MTARYWKWIGRLLSYAVPSYAEKVRIIHEGIAQGKEAEVQSLIRRWALFMTPVEMTSIIRQAVMMNNPYIIQTCLNSYSRIGELGLASILTLALFGHCEEIIETLLKLNVDWSKQNKLGGRPILIIVIECGRLEVLERLIELGVAKNLRFDWACEILQKAIDCDDLKYLQLVMKGGILVDAVNLTGSTALQYAITRGNSEAAEILLKAGADPNATNYFEQTPLERACRGDPGVLQILLKYARETESPPIAQKHLLERAVTAPYIYASQNVELLLNEGIPIDSTSQDDRCAIVTAIIHQNDEVLEILIKNKANLKISPTSGENALHVAVRYGTISAVKMILEKKECDIEERNSQGYTALKIAFVLDGYQKMEMLLREGAMLYPPGEPIHYITPAALPWFTPTIFIPLLAKETVEGRRVSNRDKETLKIHHNTVYNEFETACWEWQRMIETPFIDGISFRDLIERPSNYLLFITKTLAFRNQENRTYHDEFPTYGVDIMRVIRKLVNKRLEWEEHEQNLQTIMYNYLPRLITERIAYYLSLE